MSTHALRRRNKTVVEKVLEAVADRAEVPLYVARAVLEAFTAELPDAVWAYGRIRWPRLATFSVRARRARVTALPGALTVPAHRSVRALVSKRWRRRDGC